MKIQDILGIVFIVLGFALFFFWLYTTLPDDCDDSYHYHSPSYIKCSTGNDFFEVNKNEEDKVLAITTTFYPYFIKVGDANIRPEILTIKISVDKIIYNQDSGVSIEIRDAEGNEHTIMVLNKDITSIIYKRSKDEFHEYWERHDKGLQ